MVSRRASARFRFGCPFSSEKVVVCGLCPVPNKPYGFCGRKAPWEKNGHCLVTLSLTINQNVKMALTTAHLNAGVILLVTVQR